MGHCCTKIDSSFTDAESFFKRRSRLVNVGHISNGLNSKYQKWLMKIQAEKKGTIVEGISLKDEVVRCIGREHLTTFSDNVDLHKLWIICNIGSGGFASVFLVKKEEEIERPLLPATTSLLSKTKRSGPQFNYYAMKVIDKSLLKQKQYLTSVKLEKNLTHHLDHPFILKLHHSFQCSKKLYLLLEFVEGGSLFYHL